MNVSSQLAAQAATLEDFGKLKSILERFRRVHQHLDWNAPAAWLGRRPFYFAMDGPRAAGVFAAPPDPPDTAWVRLLAVAEGVPAGDVLRAVWPPARRDLETDQVRLVAALAINEWVGTTLAAVGFQEVKEVVVLSRRRGAPSARTTANQIPRHDFSGRLSYFIRPVRPADLPAISALDEAAFAPPWQISAPALRLALEQAARATVVEADQPPRLAGFQITTPSGHGGHLARLAVLPEFRGQGLATALVADVAAYFDGRRADSLTVNTQHDNFASLAVYERLGFKPTRQRFGVWQMRLG